MIETLRAAEAGIGRHCKVRVVVDGALLHLASRTEPKIKETVVGKFVRVDADWISSHEYGDTVGYIDWSAVTAVTWRWSP